MKNIEDIENFIKINKINIINCQCNKKGQSKIDKGFIVRSYEEQIEFEKIDFNSFECELELKYNNKIFKSKYSGHISELKDFDLLKMIKQTIGV